MEEETRAAIAKQNGVPAFKRDDVKNGYPLAAVKDPEVCPHCGEQTEFYSAEFIYTTTIGTRAMWVPGGWFCGACPTVIVDEQLIAEGMTINAKFLRVVGVINAKTNDPMYFITWLGQRTLFILDEDEQILEMRTVPEKRESRGEPAPQAKNTRRKKKAKRKQAGQARKQNRSSRKK